jgi:nucleoside-diphosphate-sugar epimerase
MADKLIVGCGYLGSRVAARWVAAGHRVFATTRRPGRTGDLRQLGLLPIVCDVLDLSSLHSLPPATTVLYAVGFDRGGPGVPPGGGPSMRQVYVEGLGNVLAALSGRIGKFLYISSTGVYGQDDGGEVDESSPAEPADDSGRVVRDAEEVLRARLPSAVVLRFAGIYGPGRLLARADALRRGELLAGDGERWLNLIHVEDGAAAVLAAEEKGRPGEVYNVCDDRPVRRREFYDRLAQLLGAPAPRFGPGVQARRSANRRVVNRRLREELGLDLRYPSLEEGLPQALAEVESG